MSIPLATCRCARRLRNFVPTRLTLGFLILGFLRRHCVLRRLDLSTEVPGGHLCQFCTEENDQSRVVDPHYERHHRSRCSEWSRHAGLAEVEANQILAERE